MRANGQLTAVRLAGNQVAPATLEAIDAACAANRAALLCLQCGKYGHSTRSCPMAAMEGAPPPVFKELMARPALAKAAAKAARTAPGAFAL